ncbi:BLOC-1-related complex subunit 6 [Esox lucius]|uniref:BLOC-1-related complex subunit 6 C-terminal helix domain-containing protein n=1 Tax=Esox lucius TaxID=8010 RepID=A0A3P8ZXI3_ESOLU|nr:BLOC-1-related complex subunit 6 [Esox lucius]
MSLCPVIGTDVPEAANGVDTPASPGSCCENGPHTHVPTASRQLRKCVGRVTCPGQGSLDGTHGKTENCVDRERSHDGLEDHMDVTHNPTFHPDTQRHTAPLPAHSSIPSAAGTADPRTLFKDTSFTESPQTDLPPNKATSGDPQQTGTLSKDGDTWWDAASGDEPQSETENTETSGRCSAETEEVAREEPYAGDAQAEVLCELTDKPSIAASGASSVPADGESSDCSPCPPHVMAQVRVRNVPERERIVRGMQDSKSLDEISQAYGGAARAGGRGGQPEGRRATISSALELEGTVSHDGDLTHFICRNLEQKIKMSSKPSLDCDCESDCSGSTSSRGRGSSLRRPADIPPIDPAVLVDLQRHTQDVAHSVELMMRSLNGTIQNMTALSVGYIQTYRDSVDSLGESVDMSIKGMYTLMARCEELDRSMQPIHTLAAQIRDIKRTLDALEAICK